MSAIARVMLEMGYQISGSDVVRQELTEKLAAKGAQIYIGHEPEHVQGADLVVYSTALAKDNVERQEAEQLNIPIIHRSQMLGPPAECTYRHRSCRCTWQNDNLIDDCTCHGDLWTRSDLYYRWGNRECRHERQSRQRRIRRGRSG